MNRVALVTGGTSGIGAAAAGLLKERGWQVYTLSRHPAELPGIRCLCADVTDEAAVRAAVDTVLAEAGKIDLLVNNAGFGISGAIEFTEPADARRQLDVNFFGMVNCCHAVLPVMRRAGGGRIISTSSVAAPVPIPFQAFYSASKSAINSYTMALANEVRPFGVSVCAVMPGDIKTGFTAARQKVVLGDDVYGGRISRSVKVMEHDEQTGMPPSAVAKMICRAAEKKKVKPLYTVGFPYQAAVTLTKLLPAAALNRIIGWIYAK